MKGGQHSWKQLAEPSEVLLKQDGVPGLCTPPVSLGMLPVVALVAQTTSLE